jgi:multicomponent Na+:H+ antiporter subunit D
VTLLQSFYAALPILVLLSSLLASAIVFLLDESRDRLRTVVYLGGEVVKLVLVLVMLGAVYLGETFETRVPLLPGLDFVLRGDSLAMLFITLSSGLWLLTTLYSIGYLRDSPNRSRFYGFFGLCVTATAGIAMSGNLFTFFVFYEALTLATYPLVVHKETPAALAAGRKYMWYTLSGGAVLLVGIVWLHVLAGPVEFIPGGAVPRELAVESYWPLVAAYLLLIAGLGVKTALVPLHGWLPAAMVAPAPVSALLHAVAVVKAGAYGIMRVVYDVFGIEFSAELGVTGAGPLAVVASVTIIYGSIRAITQDELKKRLAYSTVSQLSYITLGVAIFGPLATVGALAHLVHQGIMKITMFFCAGLLEQTLGIHSVREMSGVGRRMPLTMGAFTVAGLGMIGLPPMAGFISKWYLGLGGLEAGQWWVVGVLIASTILNSIYFLPIIYAAWFRKPGGEWKSYRETRLESDWLMLAPVLTTAALTLGVGLLAGLELSPLSWAELIMEQEYE